ncbi:hypothetical protein [Thalassospira australica]|uniref:hypothetical protein n=1 Tax=Thalassospira australica TaxID=1528106 RepID=UPI000ACAA372|nr:hypothetical protein [Thalassospira australica]
MTSFTRYKRELLVVGTFVATCMASAPVMATAWHCGQDINQATAGSYDNPRHHQVDVVLEVTAVDAFVSDGLPGKTLRLSDVAFVPEYEQAAVLWLRQASQEKIHVQLLSDQPDYLDRTPALIGATDQGSAFGLPDEDWRYGLLSKGLALLLPETEQGLMPLVRAEDQAITNRLGMWADRDGRTAYYTIANGDAGGADLPTVQDAVGRFVVVDGTVMAIEHQEWRSYLNFGTNWREDFTVALDAKTRDAMAENGDYEHSMKSWIGRKVRVRGVVEYRGGPYIALQDPAWLCVERE